MGYSQPAGQKPLFITVRHFWLHCPSRH